MKIGQKMWIFYCRPIFESVLFFILRLYDWKPQNCFCYTYHHVECEHQIPAQRVILYYQYMRSERYMHKFALHFLIAVRNLLAWISHIGIRASLLDTMPLKRKKNSQKFTPRSVPMLEISIEGCRIWPLAGKIGQKSSITMRDFNWRVQDLGFSSKNQTKKCECSIKPENWRLLTPVALNWRLQMHPSHP